jgi:hypothetical protein
MKGVTFRNSLLMAVLLAGWQLGAADHSVRLQNKTGRTANDLHVTFGHKTGNPTCTPMTNTMASTDGGFSYGFDSGSVPNGDYATVKWSSSFTPEQIQEGYWTTNGTNIGNFGESTVALNFTNNPDGTAVVTFDNMGTNPVTYANLQIFTGADQTYFTPDSFVAHMTSGQPVETILGPSGVVPLGKALVAVFQPSLAGYTAVSAQVDGADQALGSSPFPQLIVPKPVGNQVLLNLSGDPGRSYSLEYSSDLAHWNAVQTGVAGGSPATYVDNPTGPSHFYRASLLANTNGPALETPCAGGIFTGGYTVSECITGFWHVVYYDVYACPPDWQRHTYRTKQVNTGQPCTSVLNESLTAGAPNASAIRNITFGADGATFASSSSALDYSPTWFPAEGTFEIDLNTTGGGQWILDTRGVGLRVMGDAVMYVTSGQVFFAIDPVGFQNPGTLPGVQTTSFPADGQFHVISVSYGSQGLKIYTDGNLEGTLPQVAVPLVRSTITFGDYLDAVPQSFLGQIRHIRTSALQSDVQLPLDAAQGPYSFANTTQGPLNDLHVVFRGTGGSLNNPRITAGPPGAQISAQGNQVDIVFPTPVNPGASVSFTVKSRFLPITFDHGWWTLNGDAIVPADPL